MTTSELREKFQSQLNEATLKIIKIEEVKTICVGENLLAKGNTTILPAAKARKNNANAAAPI